MNKKLLAQTALVINTESRKAEKFFFRVLDEFSSAKVQISSLLPVHGSEKLAGAVEQAIATGHKLVIIGGGDGTISSLVGYFVGTDVAMGIIPLGTANSFIRSLGIPADPALAVETILKGKVEKIDVGRMNNQYYANVVSFGFTTQVAENISRRTKKYLGLVAYVIEGLRQAISAKPFQLTVAHDGQQETLSTYQVIVANGSFYGPTLLAHDATVNSGKLVVLTMKEMGRTQLVWAWLNSLFGKDLASYGVHHFSAADIKLTATPAQAVSVDGEVDHRTPLRLRIVPEAISLLVPQSFKKRKRVFGQMSSDR